MNAAKKTKLDNSLQFSVDSQLLSELGEKLVTKNYVALSELIKNAFDADSTQVTVKFVRSVNGGPSDNDGEIHIIDNGLGMTYEQLHETWMRIATPNKAVQPVSSRYGRRKTGSKGIGRFACQRLARTLVLESIGEVTTGHFEKTDIRFDWKDFVPGTNLTEVPCRYTTKTLRTGSPGLVLKLVNLREAWTEREFNVLRRQILLLTAEGQTRRKGFLEDPGFAIVIDSPEFPSGQGVLVDQFMNAGWGSLHGKILKGGNVELELEAKSLSSKKFTLDRKYQKLSGVKFEVAYLPIEKTYFRNTKLLTSKVAETIREHSGVRMYLDGFRVYPYGDADDDWLGIDRDVARRKGSLDNKALQSIASKLKLDSSRVLLAYPRHRNLIGRIDIKSAEDSPFVVKMDREGLVENEAYRSLVELLRLSLDWMTLWYAAFVRRAAKERREVAEAEFVEATKGKVSGRAEIAERALNLLTDSAKPTTAREVKHSLSVVKQAREVVRSQIDEAHSELMVLRTVASTGPLMFAFAHEVKGTIGALDTNAAYLENIAASVPAAIRKELIALADAFRVTSKRFSQLTRMFGVFTTAQNLEKKRIPILKSINQVMEGFGFVLDEFRIQIEVRVEDILKTSPMTEAEFMSIVVNLFSNAVKASIAGDGRQIRIEAVRSQRLRMRFLDKGVGLSKIRRADVFEPLNADPEDKIYRQLITKLGDVELSTLGRGTGMGLSIVRGIVEESGGTVNFVDPPSAWKTCVEVQLP